eukprot:Gb_11844 [translate_table: standard]
MSSRMTPPNLPLELKCGVRGEENGKFLQEPIALIFRLTGCHHKPSVEGGNDLVQTPEFDLKSPSLFLASSSEVLGTGMDITKRFLPPFLSAPGCCLSVEFTPVKGLDPTGLVDVLIS